MMERLYSWFSPDAMHALGWALIHSSWQCLGVAAFAAVLMAFSRRPQVRYVIGVGALVFMLAVPIGTFFLLMKAAAPIQAAPPANSEAALPAAPQGAMTYRAAVISSAIEHRALAVMESRRPLPNVLQWLVAAWLCGVVLFSLRFVAGFMLLEHKRRNSTTPGSTVLAICKNVQRKLGLDRAIRYLECTWLQAPAVIGWLRPIVLLPASVLTGLNEAQLRAVIAHELAHIRRFDVLVNFFQVLIETLLFYHPALWWLNRRVRAERELACDEIAVAMSGTRVEYARVLALMAERERVSRLAMAANRGSLTERVFHILGKRPATGQRVLGLTGSMLFLAAALGAANALFGIAYPIQPAHAKAAVKAVLASSQGTVESAARQLVPASEPPSFIDRNSRTSDEALLDQTRAATQPEKLAAPQPDLPRLATPAITVPTLMASNAPPEPPQSSSAGGQTVDGLLNIRGVADVGSGVPSELYACHNSSVTGRVISPQAIEVVRFTCLTHGYGGLTFAPLRLSPLQQPNVVILGVTLNVQLADPFDAAKMQKGGPVTLRGDFHLAIKDDVSYLVVNDARVLYGDPFRR